MTWDEMIAEVATLVNRSDLGAESQIALRQALLAAHKSAKYWRDLVEVPIIGLSTSTAVQEIDLSSQAPNFRQAVSLADAAYPDCPFSAITVDDLLDSDGYSRTAVYWGFGTRIRLRAPSPVADYTLVYYRNPVVSATGLSSWVAELYPDVPILWAAVTVLALVGEQEIRTRLESLLSIALADMRQDNLEIVGR